MRAPSVRVPAWHEAVVKPGAEKPDCNFVLVHLVATP